MIKRINTYSNDKKKGVDSRDGVRGDLVAALVHVLHGRVVGVLVGDEERGLDGAAVGVEPLAVEDLVVELDVGDVDGVVERDGDHLRDLLRVEVAGHGGAVEGAEALGDRADLRVAHGRPVRVVVDILEEN